MRLINGRTLLPATFLLASYLALLVRPAAVAETDIRTQFTANMRGG
jgi:hypothetical protein